MKLNRKSLWLRTDRLQQQVKSTKNAQDISPQISRPPMKINLIRARSRSATPYPKTIKKQMNRKIPSPAGAPSPSRLNQMTWTVAPSSTQKWHQPLMSNSSLSMKLKHPNSSWMQFLSKWQCQVNNRKKRKKFLLPKLQNSPQWAVVSMISP